MLHYTYVYLDWNFAPYYAGEGSRRRYLSPRCGRDGHARRVPVPPPERIIRFYHATKEKAFADERRLITLYGRRDLGTGILMNQTDGGEGCSNCPQAREAINKTRTVDTCRKGGLATWEMRAGTGFMSTIRSHEASVRGGRNGGAVRAKSGQLPSLSIEANHTRWHTNRGIVKADCTLCTT